MLYDYIDWKHAPISRSIIDSAKSCIPPAIMERAVKLNDKYIALSNKEFDKLVLKSNDSLTDISEGEAILKKIMEPFRGKLVLLDVWGTWCVPCKLALSNSAEEYARLAPMTLHTYILPTIVRGIHGRMSLRNIMWPVTTWLTTTYRESSKMLWRDTSK